MMVENTSRRRVARELRLPHVRRRGPPGAALAGSPVIPESAEEKRRFEDAGRRRELRDAEAPAKKEKLGRPAYTHE